MKAILYRRSDSVAIGWPTKEIVQIATGEGYQWSNERQAHEIKKMALGPENDGVGWDLATRWITSISNGGLTEAELLDLIAEKDQPKDCLECHQVEPTDLPYHIVGVCKVEDHGCCSDLNCHDRYFRDAVVFDDIVRGKCRCDMPKARVIHMDRIRKVRNAEFERRGLDRHLQTALTRGDTVRAQELEDEKQTLRDIPQKYDLSVFKTPEELKAAWPKELDEKIKEVKKGL